MGYQRHNAFIQVSCLELHIKCCPVGYKTLSLDLKFQYIFNFQSVIPKDRLLIWNIKDGWEPSEELKNLNPGDDCLFKFEKIKHVIQFVFI